jgi:histidinol-phosphate aminotransferase
MMTTNLQKINLTTDSAAFDETGKGKASKEGPNNGSKSIVQQLARLEILQLGQYSITDEDEDAICLHRNENPWSDFLIDMSESSIPLNRYPAQPKQLLNRIAEHFSVTVDSILLSRGSNEAIDLLVRTFCIPCKDAVVICPPTFVMYETSARIQSAQIIAIPLLKKNAFALDVDAIVNNTPRNIKLIFICTPNNPTGNVTDIETIASLCSAFRSRAIVVVDEAYIEFSQSMSCISLLDAYDNLVILRTLSKGYGLAGIRCGIAITSPEMVAALKCVLPPYALTSFSIHAATLALSEQGQGIVQNRIAIIRSEREKIITAVRNLKNVLKVWPSQANFILMEVVNSYQFEEYCKRYGIIIRDVSQQWDLANCVRITIGAPDENEKLIEVMKGSSLHLT